MERERTDAPTLHYISKIQSVALYVVFILAGFLLPACAFAVVVSSQPDHSLDTKVIEAGADCTILTGTSTRDLGDLTLYFGSNTAPIGANWIAHIGLFSSPNCAGQPAYRAIYKDTYQPTATNTAHAFDASRGFWDDLSYGGFGDQALSTSSPSLNGMQSMVIWVGRATVPTFSSNGLYPCGGYCAPYLQGDGTNLAYLLEDATSTAATPPCTIDCNSNVLFLPGIEASRLYRPQVVGDPEQKLWEPGIHDDLHDLYLTPEGKSVRDDIYAKTGDVIDETPGGANIYKSFIAKMNDLKAAGTIADWESAPYDWRLSLDDILAHGTQNGTHLSYLTATDTPYIIQELKRLAATSRTGKVTIIAHSNGGLVAKRLTELLGADASKLIDRMIFVAVPQVGTPAAAAALMHGYDQAIAHGIVVDEAVARTFASTSPMTYQLLPSAHYFTQVDDPVITFDSSLPDWIARYGSTIHSQERLHDFLTDAYGRVDAQTGNIDQPIQASDALLTAGEAVHADLDDWTPPAGVSLIQIAGWGVPTTLTGIEYASTTKPLFCSGICPHGFAVTAQTTIDGDGTVVVPSALWTSTTTGTQNYWMDLNDYNREHPIQSGFGLKSLAFEHSRILETDAVLDFISDQIASTTKPLADYTYLSTEAPVSTDHRLRYALHSPLTLNLYDDLGRHTGISTTTGEVEEQIPGTYYTQFGDVKYVFTDASMTAHIMMQGYAPGTFTFNVDEYQGDTRIASTTFQDIPTTASTTVALDVQSDISTLSPMRIDKDGNGTTDATIAPVPDGIATLDTTPPEITITFATSTNALAFIGTDDSGTTTIRFSTTYPNLKKNEKELRGVSTTTVTARDEAGNTTALVYTEKLPSPKQHDTVTLQEIAYNGATTTLASTTLTCKWRQNKDGAYKLFASHLATFATSTESHYRPKKNETIIMTKPHDLDDDSDDDEDIRPTKQTLPGMVILYMRTEDGTVIIGY